MNTTTIAFPATALKDVATRSDAPEARQAGRSWTPSGALAALTGAIILAFSITVMAGWLLHKPALMTFAGHPMPFSTAFCFALAGCALTANLLSTHWRFRLHSLLGTMIALVAGLVLLEYLSGADLGIDLQGLHAWNSNSGSPGRMPFATSIAFLAIAAILTSMHRVAGEMGARAVQGLTATLAILGLTVIVGYLLEWHAIFSSYLLVRVTLPEAAGFIFTAAGLWLSWRGRAWNGAVRSERDHTSRITAASAAIMMTTGALAGLVGVKAMQDTAERALRQTLTAVQQSRAELIRQEVEYHLASARLIATRPNPQRLMRLIDADPAAIAPREELARVLATFLGHDFSTLVFYDVRGNVVASVGSPPEPEDWRIPLRQASGAALLWKSGFVLETRLALHDGNHALGTMLAEQPLGRSGKLLLDFQAIGNTAEVAVCAVAGEQLSCFPMRNLPRPSLLPAERDGKPLPMSHALKGETGVIRAPDYRNQEVLAAHGPIGYGLGLVVKIDGTELYEPMRGALVTLGLLLALVAAGGFMLLRVSIRPLAARLQRSEKQLQLALKGSRLALWDWNARTGRVDLSEEWQSLLGYEARATRIDLNGLIALVHPDEQAAVAAHGDSVLLGEIAFYDIEHRVRAADGDWRWIRSRGEVVERDSHGRAVRVVGTNAEISERKKAELELARRAAHDVLTGLPNRALFQDRLDSAVARAKRSGVPIAVMYLDIDKFKSINDTHGHDVGDALIIGFGRRVQECLRNSDTVARLGGDEFAAILEALSKTDDASLVAEKIISAMRAPFDLGERRLDITTSVGVAVYDGVAEMLPQALLKRADSALYAAKAAGRNNFQKAA